MTGAVLTGGQARRMGFNKAFISLDGETIIERTLRVLKGVFDPVIIVTNEVLPYEGLCARTVTDLYKGGGSLGGIFTALFHSSGDVFVCACDMPFIDPDVVRVMLRHSKGFDAVVPFIQGRDHPLHAVYSRNCMKPIESMIKEGNLRISDLLAGIKVKRLEEEDFGLPALTSVVNINTREDLLRFRELKEAGRKDG